MNRRRTLIASILVLIAIGAMGISEVFIGSLNPSASAENDRWINVHVADMKTGEGLAVDNYFYVYRVSTSEKGLVLEDFVVYALNAPARGCELQFVAPESKKYRWKKRKQYESIPHFFEQCDGGIWTIGGKYLGTGHPEATDLIQRHVKLSHNGGILVRAGNS